MFQHYKIEFPRYDDELPTLEGFSDSSWHNDACPSITKHIDDKGTFIQIFCDYKDKSQGDFADMDDSYYHRYTIYLGNSEYDWSLTCHESNDWQSIVDYLGRFNIGGYPA